MAEHCPLTKAEKMKLNQKIRQFKQSYREGSRELTRFNERRLQLLYGTLHQIDLQDLQLDVYVQWLNTWEQWGLLSKIKSSGERKTKSGLSYYNDYHLKEFVLESDYDIDSLFQIWHPRLKTGLSYYLKHPLDFDEDYPWIQRLHERLMAVDETLAIPWTINQRSFQLFQNEKLLAGKSTAKWSPNEQHWLQVIKRLGLSETPDSLNYLELKQLPQAIEVNRKEEAGVVLILENQDPTVTLLTVLMEEYPPHQAPLDGLIFGSGKMVESTFYYIYKQFFKGVLGHPDTIFYYAGDLDIEGLQIFRRLQARYLSFDIRYLPDYLPYLIETGSNHWRTNTQRKLTNEEKQRWLEDPQYQQLFGDHLVEVLNRLEEKQMIPQEVMTRKDWRMLLNQLQQGGVLKTCP